MEVNFASRNLKYVLSLLPAILLYVFAAYAADYEGYIRNTNGDTVKGKVEVIGKKAIEFGEMETSIKFTGSDGRSKKYKAGEIIGYGYNWYGTWYHFELLDMQKNSGQKAPKMFKMFKAVNDFNVFLLRINDGALPMYKDYWNSENSVKDPLSGRERTTGTSQNYDLYVKNSDGVFVEIASPTPGGNKKFKEFLEKYLKLENDFLKTVDDKAKFSDAEEILTQYNDWKKKH